MMRQLRQIISSNQGQGALEYMAVAAVFVLTLFIAFDVLNFDIFNAACQELISVFGSAAECI